MKNLTGFIAFIAILSSCSNKEAKTNETQTDATVKTEAYTFQRAFTTIKWTAYKTTDRVAVGGGFDEFEVKPAKESGTVVELMNGLSFNIPVSSSNSENEERDGKIAKFFYGTMLGTSNITGVITSIDGNDSAGKARISMVLNEQSHEIDAQYTVQNNKITLTAHLELADWKAEPSVASLNKVCDDLHKGADGVSKLWPDVDVVVESTLLPMAPKS